MIMTNSVLTAEERLTLYSLGCKDKEKAVSVLNEMRMLLPVLSQMFKMITSLSYKLEKELIDFDYEIKASEKEFETIE